jgi:hypothetical protein
MTVPPTTHTRRRREIVRGLVLASAIIGVSLAAKFAPGFGLWPGSDWSERAPMALIGVCLVILGNAIPKTLTPLAVEQCDPATKQRIQRLAGWTWVAAGASLTTLWLVASESTANTATMLVVPAAILVNVAAIFLMRRRHPANQAA